MGTAGFSYLEDLRASKQASVGNGSLRTASGVAGGPGWVLFFFSGFLNASQGSDEILLFRRLGEMGFTGWGAGARLGRTAVHYRIWTGRARKDPRQASAVTCHTSERFLAVFALFFFSFFFSVFHEVS